MTALCRVNFIFVAMQRNASVVGNILFILCCVICTQFSANAGLNSRKYSDYKCLGYSMETRSCMFNNICFSAGNRSWLFYREEGVTSLPYDSTVDSNGRVSWHHMFEKDWRIALDVSYIHDKSKYEAAPGTFTFRPPT